MKKRSQRKSKNGEEELGHSCRQYLKAEQLLHVSTSEGELNLKFLAYFPFYMK